MPAPALLRPLARLSLTVFLLALLGCDAGGGTEGDTGGPAPTDTWVSQEVGPADTGRVPELPPGPDLWHSGDVKVDVGGHACESDTDCTPWAVGLGPCREMFCNGEGLCEARPLADGSACDDGDVCTETDLCEAGECAGQAIVCDDQIGCTVDSCDPSRGCVHETNDGDCDDQEPCTTDRCDAVAGCQHAAREGDCDDGDACTTGDICQQGVCTGEPVSCEDDNRCNGLESCDPATGDCVASAPLVCDDGDPCNGIESCEPSIGCVAGEPLSCADSDPCTEDLCVPGEGCVHLLDPELPGCILVPCQSDGDCDDEDLCTIDTCTENDYCLFAADPTCTHRPCSVDAQCNDGDICTSDECDSVADICWNRPIPGCPVECRVAAQCDDNESCTADACVEGGLCEHTPLSGPCNDGDACTQLDQCQAGRCVGGSPRNCDDGLPCTVDSCDPAIGCVNVLAPGCRDLNCQNDAQCDDGDECTTDDCREEDGTCWSVPIPGCGGYCQEDADCDDANPCSTDRCDLTTGLCDHIPDPTCGRTPCETEADCDDGDPCTGDGCADDGFCENPRIPGCISDCQSAADCDDGNPCTVDTCLPSGLCDSQTTLPDCHPCQDWWDCPNDNNFCTDLTCNEQGLCEFVFNTNLCDDQSACTTGDRCSEGACVGDAIVCDDGDPCTDDDCDRFQGCVFPYNAALPGCGLCGLDSECDDQDPCTTDRCENGECTNTPIPNCGTEFCLSAFHCDDGDPCTWDQCDESTWNRCFHYPIPGCTGPTSCTVDSDCLDDNPCAENSCNGGVCFRGLRLPCGATCQQDADCDDGAACTTDTCDPVVGCLYSGSDCVRCLSDSSCDNRDIPCVLAGVCAETRVCTSPSAPAGSFCDPPNSCFTVVGCDGQGNCLSEPVPCSDQDGNPCTIEYCDPEVPIGQDRCRSRWDDDNPRCNCLRDGDCDDGDPCTQDTCFGNGQCASNPLRADCEATSSAAACDDGDPCTIDRWHTASGACFHLADPSCAHPCTGEFGDISCVDGSACTVEWCPNGTCEYGSTQGSWADCETYYECQVDADCVTGELTCEQVCPPESSAEPDAGTTCPEICEVGEPNLCAKGLCITGACVFVEVRNCENRDCATDADCEDGTPFTNHLCSPQGTCYAIP